MFFKGHCEYCNAYRPVRLPLGYRCVTCEKLSKHKAWDEDEDDCWHPIGTALIWNEEITEIAHGIVCVSPSITTDSGSAKNQPLAQTSKKCQ